MILFLSTNYNSGYVIHGDDAIALLSILDRAVPAEASGYGRDRTFAEKEADEAPWEIVKRSQLITEQAEAEAIKSLRERADDAFSKAFNANKEKKALEEELDKVKATLAALAGGDSDEDTDSNGDSEA